MALSLGQITSSASAQQFGVLTEGNQLVVTATTANCFIGTSSSVTTSTGFLVATGGPPIEITLPPMSAAVPLWVIGTTGVLSYAITSNT